MAEPGIRQRATRNQSGAAVRVARRQTSTEALARVSSVLAIPMLLRKLGADSDAVIAEAGLDPGLFENPENLISYVARGRLLRLCAERTGCRHFGLLVGQNGGTQSLGLTGLLLKFSPDVDSALRDLMRYLHLHVSGAATSLTTTGKVSSLAYEILAPGVEGAYQTGDGAVALMFNMMRALCGPKWKPIEVMFSHRAPQDLAPYREYFGVPLRFDAEQYALVFATDWLSHRPPDADPDVRRLLQQQVDILETRHGDDFRERVRSVFRSALLAGHAKADEIATLFAMQSRTLNRRLNAYGTSFRNIADEIRFEIARQMLEDSAIGVNQIAAMLGYANASAFGRAFKRWSGSTPARWRARTGCPSPA